MKTLTYILLILHFSVFSQAQFSIQGKVLSADSEAISFGSVLLLNPQDSSMVKGTISSESGAYLFENVLSGNYVIASSYVGFQKTYSSPFYLDEPYTLEDLIMTQGSALTEVIVKESKPLYVNEIDRLVINVASSLVSAGGTALEILERSPGVTVNRQNNSIALVGKSGVAVMINGKISYMPQSAVIQMLQGMSADNIETIELITTPPAKFDAEGNAGFINIVLKKRMDEGLNGTYTVSAGYGKGFRSNDDLSLNFRKDKINLFGNYSYVLQNGIQPFEFGRDYSREGQDFSIFTFANRPWKQENHNVRVGLDYELSEKTVVGVLVNAYDNLWTMDAFNQGATKVNNAIDSYVDLTDVESNRWRHVGANFNLSHKFSEKSNMSYDIDYLNYDNSNPNEYENSFFDAERNLTAKKLSRSTKETPLYTWVSKLDFHNDINDKVSIDYGVKGSYNHFQNSVAVQNFEDNHWNTDASLSNVSVLNEKIVAAHAGVDYKLTAKTSMKVGLRYEHTDSELDTDTEGKLVDRHYGIFFPTFYLNQKVSNDFSMNLSYNKRITRPTFNDLAPFVILLDPTTFISGNAAVQPAISNSVKYAINYKSVYFGLDYSHQKSSIANFQQKYDKEFDRFIFTADNLDYTKTFSATFGSPLKVNDWWRMNNNFIFLWQQVKASIYTSPLKISVYSYQFNTTQSFKMSDQLSAEATTFVSGPSFFGTYKVNAFYGVNLGVQYKPKRDIGSFRIALTDVMESIRYKTSIAVPEENFSSKNTWDFSNRTIMITYTAKFGRNEIKSSRGRQGGAAEERARVN